jgi:ATP adenylyltransferase/5',5'''-P-1,P-4-tetraphosphate phosphorylase II
MKEAVENLYRKQLDNWELAANNYKALALVKTKQVDVDGWKYLVQFNPARIVSSSAKIDPQSIKERKCFLCRKHLPAQQEGLSFGEHYTILVNPFPIFPKHLTIPDDRHLPQRINGRIGDMLDLAKELDDYVVFYNGPKCGASAPDHMHFQAGSKGFLTLESEWKFKKAGTIVAYKEAILTYLNDTSRATLVIESTQREDAITLFETVYDALPSTEGEEEPMMNILTWYEAGKWIICVFPRKKHRPACYFAEGEENILLSPASVDMGGVFITPLEKDFIKITAENVKEIMKEVSLSNEEFHEVRQLIKERL